MSLRRVMLTRVLSPGGHKVPAASGGSSPARLAVRSPSMRPCSREEGESTAAAAAMDKMFDFSAW